MEYTITMRTEGNWFIMWAFGGVLSKQWVSVKRHKISRHSRHRSFSHMRLCSVGSVRS